jgi:hypothetical protein
MNHPHLLTACILISFVAATCGFVFIHVAANEPEQWLLFFGLYVSKNVVLDVGLILVGAVIVILLTIVLEANFARP